MPTPDQDVVLCDTSFLSHAERQGRSPDKYAHWPVVIVERLEKAHLAISPFSLAELKAGRVADRWGEKRCDAQDARLAALLLIPLDPEIVDTWAELRADGHQNGWRLKDNDLWIAATALAKGIPLASCDSDHQKVPGLDLIYLPADAPTSG